MEINTSNFRHFFPARVEFEVQLETMAVDMLTILFSGKVYRRKAEAYQMVHLHEAISATFGKLDCD